jgi:hypothetical protein
MVPEGSVRRINRDSFIETQSTDLQTGSTLVTIQAKSSHLPIGVSQIKYKDGGDYILTLSAKTLKDNYLDGINLNNWDKAIQGVDEILDIDLQNLWDSNPKVLRCDTTDNISIEQIGYSKADICRSLYASKLNGRFVSKWYQSKRKLGVEFAGTQEEKNRIICYDKMLDLMKSSNKEFIKSLANPISVFNKADKTIRFETNHTAFRSMRDRFKISQNNLQEVLNSNTPVNHNFLKKALQTNSQLSLFEEIKQYKGRGMDFIMLKGYEHIIRELNYNPVLVRDFLKEALGKRSSKYYWTQVRSMPTIKEMVSKLKIEQDKEAGSMARDTQPLTICNSVLEALRMAV